MSGRPIKKTGHDSKLDNLTIVLRSLIMLFVSKGFVTKECGDTLLDFLKSGPKRGKDQ